ncbi:MAG: CDP-glucose 4,6-dehydratase [Chitinophagia bacterium]
MVNYPSFTEIYRGKKVFLTGHTGFKGSWLLQTLQLFGAIVRGYALSPIHDNDLYNCIEGDKLCESIIADIRDSHKLRDAIIEFQPDFIFHLAAQPLVIYSYNNPIETYEVNVLGTLNLLDAIRHLEKKCSVILITTDKVYKNKEWNFSYKETDLLGGYDPYSSSKACCELVIDSYRNSFFNPALLADHRKGIAVARAGNVIGGGDWAEHRLIPDVVRALRLNNSISIRNPSSVRPWQHVLEPIFAYLLLGGLLDANPIKHGTAYNFGPSSNDTLTVKQVVERAIQIWGSGKYTYEKVENPHHEAGLLQLDISKANADLGWFPKMNTNSALQLTIDWYQNFFNKKETIINLTKNQILNYWNYFK